MKERSLAYAALIALSPLAGAMAQGTLSPVIPAGDKAQANEAAIGHSDGHRPFFYWLTGDASEPSPAPVAGGNVSHTPTGFTPSGFTPAGVTSTGVIAPGGGADAIADGATSPLMKTGTSIGTK